MSNRPKPRLSSIGDPIKPYTRAPTGLGSIGDPMSELNIQRRLQWWRERNPAGIIRVSQEMADKDPAVRRALLELDYVQLEQPRVRKE